MRQTLQRAVTFFHGCTKPRCVVYWDYHDDYHASISTFTRFANLHESSSLFNCLSDFTYFTDINQFNLEH